MSSAKRYRISIQTDMRILQIACHSYLTVVQVQSRITEREQIRTRHMLPRRQKKQTAKTYLLELPDSKHLSVVYYSQRKAVFLTKTASWKARLSVHSVLR